MKLFQEGMRGDDNLDVPGTGHGLSFIRLVVEMHGGSVGYEPTPEGNNFYFILPLPPLDYPLAPVRPPIKPNSNTPAVSFWSVIFSSVPTFKFLVLHPQ